MPSSAALIGMMADGSVRVPDGGSDSWTLHGQEGHQAKLQAVQLLLHVSTRALLARYYASHKP